MRVTNTIEALTVRNTGVSTGSTIPARASTAANIVEDAFASVASAAAAATTACVVPPLLLRHY